MKSKKIAVSTTIGTIITMSAYALFWAGTVASRHAKGITSSQRAAYLSRKRRGSTSPTDALSADVVSQAESLIANGGDISLAGD